MSKQAAAALDGNDCRLWFAVAGLCTGILMIAMDATIVNVALSRIKVELQFSDSSLVWVVNAYVTTFGGFLLLGGRLGDLFGHRRAFLLGIALFVIASIVCGLAPGPGLLIGARSIQGLAGAVVSASALCLTMGLFGDMRRRARALGLYALVAGVGGSFGLLIGGALTTALSWHWIFLVNVPIGASAYAVCRALIPHENRKPTGRLDLAGAVTATISLVLVNSAIVNIGQWALSAAQNLVVIFGAGLLAFTFIAIEARADAPIVPLRLFRIRTLTAASIAGTLFSSGLFGWFFIASLYLQFVLNLSPLRVGLAFLPANAVTAVMSVAVVPKLTMRFGVIGPLVVGMLITAVGLALFARAPLNGDVVLDVIPGMLLVGIGAGMAYNPLMLCAVSGVPPNEYGVASGIVNTSSTIGGSLGLSVLAGIAASRTDDLFRAGVAMPLALHSGYQLVFCFSMALVALAAMIGAVFLGTAGHLGTRAPAEIRTAKKVSS